MPAVQYDDQVGKILPRCAEATKERIPAALPNGRELSAETTNLKVEDDATLDESMPPLPLSQATDDPLSDESWPPQDYLGIKPVVPTRTEALSS